MKEKERLHEIRDFLIQQEKATWTEISNATRIQPKELSYDLRKLLNNKEITTEQDAKDRRKTWYMLSSKKKTEAETKRYETTEFILSLKNPVYIESRFEDTLKKFRIQGKTGIFFEETENIKAKEMTYLIDLESLSKLFLKKLGKLVEDMDRCALTITFERNRKP